MKVLFRVESSSEIGWGHLMRCFSMASYLKDLGCDCVFSIFDEEGSEFLKSKGFEVIGVKKIDVNDLSQDAAAFIEVISDRTFDILVVDNYSLDMNWEERVRKCFFKVLVIDDLEREHSCDYLVDTTLGKNLGSYSHLSKETKLFVGAENATLRKEFLRAREKAFLYKGGSSGIQKIVINLGGGDNSELTYQILKMVWEHSGGAQKEITVISSSDGCFNSEIKSYSKGKSNIKILSFCEDMASLYTESDLAIGAAGTSSYERAFLGLPTVMFKLAENQNDNILGFQKMGLAQVVDFMEGPNWQGHFSQGLDYYSLDKNYKNAVDLCWQKVSCFGFYSLLEEIFQVDLFKIRRISDLPLWVKDWGGGAELFLEDLILGKSNASFYHMEAFGVPLSLLRVYEENQGVEAIFPNPAFASLRLKSLCQTQFQKK